MQKYLDITISPIIGYTMHAYPLSVVMSHSECMPWFFCNHIQLVCNPSFKDNFFDFHTLCSVLDKDLWIDSIYPGIPWLNRSSIENSVIEDFHLDVCDIIVSSINHDNYAITAIDEYLSPNLRNYNIKHYYHEIMFYGYDTSNRTFTVLAFDVKEKFREITISFDVVEKSFFNKAYQQFYFEGNPIKCLKFNDEFAYELDINLIYQSILCYLQATNNMPALSYMRNLNNELVYGIKVYDELAKYYSVGSSALITSNQFDLRPLHLLWEHKKCMLMRLLYLSKHYQTTAFNDIYSDYTFIEKQCLIMKKLLIKFMISRDISPIMRINKMLYELPAVERTVLERLVKIIEQFQK